MMFVYVVFVFFKQKTAYEMRISDWSSDVCSSDLGKVRIGSGRLVNFDPAQTWDLGLCRGRTAMGWERTVWFWFWNQKSGHCPRTETGKPSWTICSSP